MLVEVGTIAGEEGKLNDFQARMLTKRGWGPVLKKGLGGTLEDTPIDRL